MMKREMHLSSVISFLVLLLSMNPLIPIQAEEVNDSAIRFDVYSIESLQNDLNEQLNRELESSYLYMGISTYFSNRSLDGFAHWFLLQAEEERGHAKKIFDFLVKKKIPILFSDIKMSNYKVKSALEAFEMGLQHERFITSSINGIYASANGSETLDSEVKVFLHWFINEQVEEESTFERIVDKLKMIGDSNEGLIILDTELGRRTAGN